MAELEHIRSILKRVFQQLEKDWEQQRGEEEIETICQESTIEANQA